MDLLAYEAAAQWCISRGLHVQQVTDGLPVMSDLNALACIDIAVEDRPAQHIVLARMLLGLGNAEPEFLDFSGGLFWLRRWNIGAEVIEQVGMHIALALLGAPYGHATQTRLDQAELFDGSEAVGAQTAVALTLLMEWDAYFVPESGIFVIHMSHDGYVRIASPNKTELARIRQRFADGRVPILLERP